MIDSLSSPLTSTLPSSSSSSSSTLLRSTSSSKRRIDGRANGGTLRPLSCELSCLHRADGSALWRAGSSHVLGAVYGPVSPQIVNQETASRCVVSVVIKSGGNSAGDASSTTTNFNNNSTNLSSVEHEMSDTIAAVLTSAIVTTTFPRCVIEVVLHVIRGDGSLLACMIHASVAALLDAGVDLLYLPVATTCLVRSGGHSSPPRTQQRHGMEESTGGDPDSTDDRILSIVLDPTAMEEQDDRNSSVVVLINDHTNPHQIMACHTIGQGITLDEMVSCIHVASKACQAVPAFWRLAVEQKVTRESQTLWSR
jgi:exosome complex component RRP46